MRQQSTQRGMVILSHPPSHERPDSKVYSVTSRGSSQAQLVPAGWQVGGHHARHANLNNSLSAVVPQTVLQRSAGDSHNSRVGGSQESQGLSTTALTEAGCL
jgi:hypothetical protein